MDSSFLNLPVIIFSLLLLLIAGCQQTSSLSEEEKLQKITTMYRNYAQEFPQVKEITAEKLQKLLQQKEIVLVDVRSPEERMISIIPGAISQAEFEKNLDRYQNQSIVVYCTIGYRSGKYAQKLQKRGLKVLNLAGSLLAWSYIDGELIDGSGSTNKIHVFGKKWELTADSYEAIW